MTWHHVALIFFVVVMVALVGHIHDASSYQHDVLNLATIICSATLGHAGAQRYRNPNHDAGTSKQGD